MLLQSVHTDAVTVVEIMAGSVLFENNFQLCFVNTILWSDVLTHKDSNISFLMSDSSIPTAKCNYRLLNMFLIVDSLSDI